MSPAKQTEQRGKNLKGNWMPLRRRRVAAQIDGRVDLEKIKPIFFFNMQNWREREGGTCE
jgi:hypothetical protein